MKTLLLLSLLAISTLSWASEEEENIDSATQIIKELNQIHSMGSDWYDKLRQARYRASQIDPTVKVQESQKQEAYYD